MWLTFADVWRPKLALAQGVVVRTNSRDTIYNAEISPACGRSEALHATASRAVYNLLWLVSGEG